MRDGVAGIVVPQRRELAEVDAAELQRGQPGVDRVRHVVAVDLGVVRVGDVHHAAVGPDAARAVVAGPAQLAELLVTDSSEVFRALRRLVREHGQAVGEEAFRVVVGDPDGEAVGPDVVWVVVGGVEAVLGEQVAAREVVGEEGVIAVIEHPHRRSVGPDAAWVVVVGVQCEVGVGEALAAGEVVREELVPAAVGDPDGRAVRPDAAGRAVALVQLELAVRRALAALQVVGVDRVAGAVGVVGEPERLTVRPEAGGLVIAAVERLDVVLHGPLVVGLARGRAARAAPAAAASSEDDRWPDHLVRICDSDYHVQRSGPRSPIAVGGSADGDLIRVVAVGVGRTTEVGHRGEAQVSGIGELEVLCVDARKRLPACHESFRVGCAVAAHVGRRASPDIDAGGPCHERSLVDVPDDHGDGERRSIRPIGCVDDHLIHVVAAGVPRVLIIPGGVEIEHAVGDAEEACIGTRERPRNGVVLGIGRGIRLHGSRVGLEEGWHRPSCDDRPHVEVGATDGHLGRRSARADNAFRASTRAVYVLLALSPVTVWEVVVTSARRHGMRRPNFQTPTSIARCSR